MKRYGFLILLILLLGGLVVYLYLSQKKSTLKQEISDFSVKDTARIDKIFMADRNGISVTLEKINGTWMVDKTFKARTDGIKTLLNTLYALKVKDPVGRAAYNNVIKDLATTAVKTEVYAGEEKLKTLYVGGPTKEHDGTFMMLEGSDAPFVTEIPGFQGYLSTRFFTDKVLWRKPEVFAYRLMDMRKVEMTLYNEPSSSFSIDIEADNENQKFVLRLHDSRGKEIPRFDTATLVQYLGAFRSINYEFPANNVRPSKLDSALQKPVLSIRVTEKNGSQKLMQALALPVPPGSTDRGGNLINYDAERVYLLVNNNRKDILIGQYFVLDRLAVPLSSFLKK